MVFSETQSVWRPPSLQLVLGDSVLTGFGFMTLKEEQNPFGFIKCGSATAGSCSIQPGDPGRLFVHRKYKSTESVLTFHVFYKRKLIQCFCQVVSVTAQP